MNNKRRILAVFAGGMILGMGIWYIVDRLGHYQSEDLSKRYPLLAKRILIEEKNDVLVNFQPLRRALQTEAADWGETFALYFEYLPTGVSIGVNSTTAYMAASLIKVPAAMAYFYSLERKGINNLSTLVTIEEDQLDNRFGSLWKRGAGTKLTLQEVLTLALTESDNTAYKVLADHIPMEDFDAVFNGLDIELGHDGEFLTIGPKSYSSILKALYFSSLLSYEHSQTILELLTQSAFNDKLHEPIPESTLVAHKIGLYEDVYQDCGIVYVPKRPYILCMMSRSDNMEATRRMNLISRLVYKFIVSANGNNDPESDH